MIKKITTAIIYIAAIFLLFFCAEMILRFFFPLQTIRIDSFPPEYYRLSPNPRLGYELRPNTHDINSDGFRGPEYTIEKAPDVTRIAIIGDSIACGFGFKYSETYSALLSDLLNQDKDARYEVLNFGVNGYGTVQIAERFKEKVLKYQPDIVIYGYWFNDFHNTGCADFEYPFFTTLKGKTWELYIRLQRNIPFLKYARSNLIESQIFTRLAYLVFEINKKRPLDTVGDSAFTPGDPACQKVFEIFKKAIENAENQGLNIRFLDRALTITDFTQHWNALKEMAELSRKNGIRFVLLTTPVLFNSEEYHYQAFHDYVDELALSLNLERVDTLSYFKKDGFSDCKLFGFDWCHFNQYGHALVARSLSDYLSYKE
jgi:lysophospholipase L1-like esterase